MRLFLHIFFKFSWKFLIITGKKKLIFLKEPDTFGPCIHRSCNARLVVLNKKRTKHQLQHFKLCSSPLFGSPSSSLTGRASATDFSGMEFQSRKNKFQLRSISRGIFPGNKRNRKRWIGGGANLVWENWERPESCSLCHGYEDPRPCKPTLFGDTLDLKKWQRNWTGASTGFP